MKKWFIIEDENHYGPYSEKNLFALLENKKITEQTLIWSEGLATPISMSSFISQGNKSYADLSANKSIEVNLGVNHDFIIEKKNETRPSLDISKDQLAQNEITDPLMLNPLVSDLPPRPPIEIDGEFFLPLSDKDVKPLIKKSSEQNSFEIKIEEDSSSLKNAEDLASLKGPTSKEKAKILALQKDSQLKIEIDSNLNRKLSEEDFRELTVGELKKIYAKDEISQESKRARKIEILSRSSLVLAPFLGFIVYLIAQYLNNYYIMPSAPSLMRKSDYNKALILMKDDGQIPLFQFFLSSDKSQIILATNLPFEGKLKIKGSALSSYSLGDEPIVFEANADLQSRFAIFKNFNFKKGKRIIDGQYEIRIQSLTPLKKSFITKIIDSRSNHIDHFMSSTITSLDPKELERLIKERSRQKNLNEKRFYEDLTQKYQTIRAMGQQITESLRLIHQGDLAGHLDRVKKFENEYTQNFGLFFTNFVIANEQSFNAIKYEEFESKIYVTSEFQRLSAMARDFGEKIVLIISNLQQLNLSDTTLENYQLKVTMIYSPLNLIIDECIKKEAEIQQRLSAYP